MPKTDIDYANTIIYKLMCNDDTIKDVYVGHTTNFVKRKYQHKKCCSDSGYSYGKVYEFINNHGGWENWSMVELEVYPCGNRQDALFRERYWIDKEKSTLNILKPWSKEDHEYQKVLSTKTREQILQEKKERHERALANLRKGRELRMQKSKEYYHANLEQERERGREKQQKHYNEVIKPKMDIIKAYLIIEDLKKSNPEYLEEIKCILAN